MLTAKSMLEDKLNGLENGADDYLTKSFHIEELLARVNIQLNKTNTSKKKKISYEDIKSNKRPPNIAIPRQVAMYLCRKLTNESFERIGIEFGGKNHATVMHSCNKIETSLKSNMELKEAIIHIEQELK